jgi:hypothetical protein
MKKEEIDSVNLRSCAKLLIKIIKKYKLRKTIVYLWNCNELSKFKKHLEDIKESCYSILTVHSANSYIKNTENMDMFKIYNEEDNCDILLSVGMFNEGIDLKMCDSVMFTNQKSSETCIVQNIGRALRKYEDEEHGYIKNKAYVIIPTAIHNPGETAASVYSSKYKTIRAISDKMREKKDTPIFYKRNPKTFNSLHSYGDDEDIVEQSNLIDNKVICDCSIINNENKKDIDESKNIVTINDKVKDLSNMIIEPYNIISSGSTIGNTTLEMLRELIKRYNITNIPELGKKMIEEGIIIVPHIDYKQEFISYSELFEGNDSVYDFETAKTKIKTHLNLDEINKPEEWFNFCSNHFNSALKGDIIDNDILDVLMHIPQSPSKYYIGDWKNPKLNDENDQDDEETYGWSDFLGKSMNETTQVILINSNSKTSTTITNQLNTLVNDDRKRVEQLKRCDYNTYENKMNINNVKEYIEKYIETKFGKKIECELEIRVKLNNNLLVDAAVINVRIKTLQMSYVFIPITINIIDSSISYDEKVFIESKIDKLYKANKNKKEYINHIIKRSLDELLNEIKQHYRNIKMQDCN